MLRDDVSRRLTEVGPETPAGRLMRCYWQPIAISGELAEKPLPVRILGESLMLYRGESGKPYLVAERCPHRLTSLSEGRIKGETIRCCYHGWQFDGTGQCLEQPGEGARSFAANVKIKAYPAEDRHGMIWAYLGAGAPPLLPPYDILVSDKRSRRVARADVGCNYFQLLENSLDPVHTAILHVGSHLQQAYEEIPEFEVEATDIGVRSIAWRESSKYKRQLEFIFPTMTRFTLPFMKPAVQMGFWVVPVDDTHTTIYFSWFLPTDADIAADREEELIQYMENQFELDPAQPFTIASLVTRQDIFACESQGEIMDRTKETLGWSDRGVVMLRKAVLAAIDAVERGEAAPAVLRDTAPTVIRFDKVA
jgi:5,5'-dehydrodivanillate O-demethylase oxygenase subunit